MGNFTYKQILAVDGAISRVRDKRDTMGSVVSGCTFTSPIMFLNAYNQDTVSGLADSIIEGAKPLNTKYKDKEGQWIDGRKGMEKFLAEEAEYLKTVEKGVKLRKYSMKELSKIDDKYLQKANENTPVPQEYISLLMEAGLIDDDLKK